MEIIIAVVSFLAGLIIGFILRKNSPNKNDSVEIASLQTRLEEKNQAYQSALEEKDTQCQKLLKEKEKMMSDVLQQQQAHHKEALDNLQSRFDETVKKMQEQLQNTTSFMLKSRQEEFEKSSKEGIAHVLEPLETSIAEMRKAISDNTIKHTEFGGMLSANIENMLKHTAAAKESADRLTNALRSNGRVQGSWGETVLKELLESQNLTEGVHFDTQVTLRDLGGNVIKNTDGTAMRPDVILHLDNQRDVIIDSKVSLSAYFDYLEADTVEEREMALKSHIESIERHVKELAQKDYSNYVVSPRQKMGYVIMFVPNTAALHLALSKKQSLWRKAMDQNVYIADEQTLYAALKIVNLTWSQIIQAQNHEKVYDLAEEMLNRVSVFMEKYVSIGKNLEQATKSYTEGMSKLQDGGHSIPQTCQKLRRLGARQTKKVKGVPDNLLGIEDVDLPVSAEV